MFFQSIHLYFNSLVRLTQSIMISSSPLINSPSSPPTHLNFILCLLKDLNIFSSQKRKKNFFFYQQLRLVWHVNWFFCFVTTTESSEMASWLKFIPFSTLEADFTCWLFFQRHEVMFPMRKYLLIFRKIILDYHNKRNFHILSFAPLLDKNEIIMQ
jgi:hypothetical protein